MKSLERNDLTPALPPWQPKTELGSRKGNGPRIWQPGLLTLTPTNVQLVLPPARATVGSVRVCL